jgi:23S rRNA (guanosine2251-2'-O)-methyltransferase
MGTMLETLYGRNGIHESLRAGRRKTYRLLVAEGIRESDTVNRIISLAKQTKTQISRVQRRDLDQLGDVHHQGVALETSNYPYSSLDDILELAQTRDEPPLLLLLDLLKDPQNVGSLLRTAETVGVHGVVIQRRRAVSITPAVVHASAGAVEHLLVAQVTNLADTINRLKQRDLWVAGLEATDEAQSYHKANLTGALALVVGSEGEGLRRLVRERCDFLLQLPMHGQINSLNAAVAGSIVLYECLRQRGQGANSC